MTEIVAEIGVNHNGNIHTAKDLVNIAIDSGVDAVKFQTWGADRFPDIEHLRIGPGGMEMLFDYCDEKGISWWCTPFDDWSIKFLKYREMKTWKIPSGMVTNFNYLEAVRGVDSERFIVSTGMCNSTDVVRASGLFDNCILLHCTSIYPTPIDEINLSVIENGFFDGISDHSGLVEIPVAATALGASMIEVHITHSKNDDGPDHKASLEPDELKTMVRMCRNVEKAMGSRVKIPTPSELKVRDGIRERMNWIV